MKRILRLLLALVIVAGILAGGVALVNRKKTALENAPTYGLRPIPVRAATAERETSGSNAITWP
ncbi:MAG: hypothetical protein U5R49_04810 [Deltaproteobacteria bacterium]|nr:hypothetical protein [Deltaproteobacteria bacterium]